MASSPILVKPRASLPANDSCNPSSRIALFDVTIAPRVPIRVGQRVKLLALNPCDDLFPSKSLPNSPHYTTKETGVVGMVVGIRAMDGGITEFVVRNDNDASATSHAFLAVQHIQGKTVNISMWDRIRRSLLTKRAPATRRIPIETNAIVFMDTTTVQPRFRETQIGQTGAHRRATPENGHPGERGEGSRSVPQSEEGEDELDVEEPEDDEDDTSDE